jgi:hypothetical protein
MSFLTVIAFAVGVISLAVVPRSLRKMRQGDEEWRERWGALDPNQRKAILREMRRGEPVRDPDDAELALRAVAQLDYVRGAMCPVDRAWTLALIALVIAGLVEDQQVIAIVAAMGLVLGTLFAGIARLRRHRLHQSAERTRALLL